MGATAASVAMGRAGTQRGGTLTLCAYGGVFEGAYRRAVVEPFLRANPGISVDYQGVLTSAQMLGMLRAQRVAPQIDVCLIDVSSAKAATDEGLLSTLSRNEIPQLDELHPRALVRGVAGPATVFEHLCLLYSPTAFRVPPTSWHELWEETHDGEIAIQRPPNTAGIAFTLLANFLAGESDYMRSYRRGIDSVATMAPRVLNWDPRPDPYAFIVNGMARLGVGWNPRAQLYARQSPRRIAAVLPHEGSVAHMVMITQVRSSPSPELARRFIGHALDAEAQSRFASEMYYTPANRTAKVDPAAAGRIATLAQIEGMLPVDWLQVATIRDRLSQDWRRKILLRR